MGPTFVVGIGGQKCGTSWLADYLFDHPQVLRNPIKEMHVCDALFAPDIGRSPARARRNLAATEHKHATLQADSPDSEAGRKRRQRRLAVLAKRRDAWQEVVDMVTAPALESGLEGYQRYFQTRVEPSHRCFGEFTPSYALLPVEGFRELAARFEPIRFVFLMRDPVDRLWSALRHAARNTPGFDPTTEFDACLTNPKFTRRSRYEETLRTLDEAGVAPQTVLCFTEDLFGTGGERELQRITTALGLDPTEGALDQPVNEGQNITLPESAARRAVTAFRTTYAAVEDRFGRIPDRWRERLALPDR